MQLRQLKVIEAPFFVQWTESKGIASCTDAHCTLHVRRVSDRASGRLSRRVKNKPALNHLPPQEVDGWALVGPDIDAVSCNLCPAGRLRASWHLRSL